MGSKPIIDWFDGTITEQPVRISINVTQASESSTESKIQHPTVQFRKKRLMGFKQLEDMAQLESSQLMLRVSNTRSAFFDLLEASLKPDYYVLIMRIISKLCEDDFRENKVRIIKRICQTKLIDELDNYLHVLPDTRIVEKRLNLLFWNDIERFLHDVILFCETVLNMLRSDYIRKIGTLVAAVKECIEGLNKEHKERFSDDIQNYLLDVESKVITYFSTLDFADSSGSQQSHPVECDSVTLKQNIRSQPILPTLDDLFSTNPRELEVNVVNGAYKSVEHYIEVHFNLLREDFIGPLREGIKSYRANSCNKAFDGVRIHEDVEFLSMYVTGNKIGHLLSFNGQINKKHGFGAKNNLSMTKRFMYGALLLFTNDDFRTVICGTVVDSDVKLLRDGLIVVSLSNLAEHPSTLIGRPYLMIESEVYYEPYFQVLNALQDLNPHEFPMKEYIVDVQPHTKPPSYLTCDTRYLYSNSDSLDEVTIPVLQTDKWPDPGDFCLNQSQYEAYKLALTREFAVIQGPPGTGKTFVGLKIANTLLANVNLMDTPMLIICYTNHALDQFSEGILKVTTDIVRVGGQSRSEVMEPYTLSSLRMRNKSKHGYLYHEKKREIEILMSKMMNIQGGLEKCNTGLAAFQILKHFMNTSVASLVAKIKSGEDPLLTWLFADCDGVKESYLNDQNEITEHDDWYNMPDDELKRDDQLGDIEVKTCFSSADIKSEIESIRKSMKYVKDMHNDSEGKVMEEKFSARIDTLLRREKYFKKRMVGGYSGHKCFTTTERSDVEKLSADQRWAIYFESIKNLKDYLNETFSQLENEYNRVSKQCDEVRMMMDKEILKSAKVVAMTTTAAARLHQMLRSLKSPIVIVEEAAEVLECHIIVSLTKHCRHLILIGDHQQLRPMASHYKLAKEFFLEVSLFERMIRNGVHSRTLSIQHRMRPAFADLITPSIYPQLHNHPSVESYPPIRGVTKNLYFIKHNKLEDAETVDSNSHRNVFEAEMILGLANYLMQQDYKPDELTILATYTGQMLLMKEMSKGFKFLDNVKMTVVDNYQGEENKIILLSLVRSNKEGKIGFLAIKNRICVALSRAREGFYIIGNMDLLQSQSTLWRDINTSLEKQNTIGHTITLCCNSHANKFSEVSRLTDFSKVENGGCDELCNAALPCGHYCKLRCHGYDRLHQQYTCYEPCKRKICVGGHPCPLSCHEPCDLCSIKVFKMLPCGHDKQLPCFTDADDPDVVCMAVVQLVLPACEHKVGKNCYLDVKKFKCPICKNARTR